MQVELPELSSASEIDLDITERRLELAHSGAGYELRLALPYEVLSDQGSAKFDKAKKLLTVTLPVVAELSPMPVWTPSSSGQTDSEAQVKAEAAAEAEARRVEEEQTESRRRADREARQQRAKQEADEREARIKAAQAQADREAARRAKAAAGASIMSSARQAPPVPSTVAVTAADASGSTAAVPNKRAAGQRANDEGAVDSDSSAEWVIGGLDGGGEPEPVPI